MEQEIREFIEYLHNTKKTSQNTEVSYQRDLNKMAAYLEMKGIMKAEDVREFDLMGYMEMCIRDRPGTALDEKGMRRLQGFLLRRGFSYGDISHVLEDMNITCERSY